MVIYMHVVSLVWVSSKIITHILLRSSLSVTPNTIDLRGTSPNFGCNRHKRRRQGEARAPPPQKKYFRAIMM